MPKSAPMIGKAISEAFDLWMYLSFPLLFMAMVGAIIGNVGQFGFLLSSHPIKFDLKKISPLAGLKRMFSKQRFVELLKQLIKFCVVFFVIYVELKNDLRNVSLLFRLKLSSALLLISDLLMNVVVKVLLCFLIIAGFDFFWQRYAFLKSMRMSKYEVKKEYKQQEGDPHIKSERRRLHQETLESKALNNIGEASVIITNPRHIAVALRYDEDKDQAPSVIAKGMAKRAKIIIDQAQSLKIPIMRNVPLAKDLIWLDINEEIPQKLYESVAEVLTFVHELSEKSS